MLAIAVNWTPPASRVILLPWHKQLKRPRRSRARSIRSCSSTSRAATRSRSWSCAASMATAAASPWSATWPGSKSAAGIRAARRLRAASDASASNSGSWISKPPPGLGGRARTLPRRRDKGRRARARAANRRALRRGAAGDVLDKTPERMREVHGLGAVVARAIATAWRDSSGLRELTVFLRGTRDRRRARAAHPQDSTGGLARGRAPRSLRARAHHSRHRISHRRHDRRETRHPAQLDPARARRGGLPARTHGRRGPRLSRPSAISSISSAPRSRWTRARGADASTSSSQAAR